MIKFKIVWLGCLLLLAVSNGHSQRSVPWQNIFDGTSLKGWQVIGNKGRVLVADSAIECHMTANTTTHTFAATKNRYKNFILELDCKRDAAFNSGILFRSNKTPDTASVSLYGYQVKLDPNEKRKWTGGIFDDFGKTWNWIYDLSKDPAAQNANRINEWNHFRIEMIGDHIRVWVNDMPVVNLQNDKYKGKGYIAFKMHALGDKSGQEALKAQFRNIRIITKNPEKYSRPVSLPLVIGDNQNQ